MGQAKKRLARFKEEHPWCCFCGGTTPTESVDHQPAAIIFPNKHRPKGHEFPACYRCNGQTKADEPVLGLVSRMSGSLRPGAQLDPDRISDMVNTVDQAYPGLPLRMFGPRVLMPQAGETVPVGSFNVNDPQIEISFRKLGTQFALATYYGLSNIAAPVGTRVQAHWEHCQDPNTFRAVERFLAICPMQSVLKQGEWEVEESFFLRYAYGERQLFAAAIFYESLALLARLFEPPVHASKEHDDLDMGPSPEFGIALID